MPKRPPKHGAASQKPAGTPHVALAEQYVAEVLDGTIPACKWVRLACQRHADDSAREADPAWPYRLDAAKAERVCQFIELLPHTRGDWAARRETIRLEPWQAFLLVSVFGQVRKADGLRRFRNAMMLVPRKNGKSALSSGVGLFMLAADGEHAAEVFCGAPTERQAWEVFRAAKLMAKGTDALRSHYGIAVNASNLNILSTGSRFEPVIGKPGDGSSPSCAILDEAHEHDGSDLRDTMITGMGARSQPLLWTITTAGDNLAGPCFDDVLTGRKILDGTITDERRFYVEWTIDDEDDWTSPAALRKANPNYGVSVGADFLREQQASAVRNTRDQGRFKTKHLNLWVNSKSAFFNMQSWNAARVTLDPEELRGEPCVIGVDLAAEQDIAALQLLFPREDGSFLTFGRYYLPEEIIRAPGNDHYAGWLHAGRIVETDGNMTDLHRIQDDLVGMIETYRVTEVVFDPMQANMIMSFLSGLGVPVFKMLQAPRDMHAPMHYLAAAIDAGRVRHGNAPNDPMSWMMSNVVVRGGFDLQKPSKERRELKIDGPQALIMAMARCMTDEKPQVSVYETRGLIVLG